MQHVWDDVTETCFICGLPDTVANAGSLCVKKKAMQPVQIRRLYEGIVTKNWRNVIGVVWLGTAPHYVTMEEDNTFVDFWPVHSIEGATYEFRPYERL